MTEEKKTDIPAKPLFAQSTGLFGGNSSTLVRNGQQL